MFCYLIVNLGSLDRLDETICYPKDIFNSIDGPNFKKLTEISARHFDIKMTDTRHHSHLKMNLTTNLNIPTPKYQSVCSSKT